MVFMNETALIGTILLSGASTTTGTLFIALIVVMIIMFALCVFFGIQLEYTLLIMIPYLIACMTQYTDFVAIGGVAIFYFAILITKSWLFK